ncbi:hypothetical protein GCM10023187_38310 [Nibrella viscosa]|uniref:DUF5723 domain-containing protein n=1 Tax=Nibrella viscosa TaxID=1084524 RepID=A0ABP8KNP9_9BACT
MCLLLATAATQAQHMPGLMGSNYGGVYRILQNPSAVAGSRYRYQVVGTIGSSITNRYFRQMATNDFLHIIRIPYSDKLYRDLQSIGSLTEAPRHTVTSEIIGPSVLFSPDRRQAFALHTRMQSFVYGQALPLPLTRAYGYGLYDRRVTPGSGALNATIAQQQYAEVGLTYGLRVFEGKWHRLSVGATGRRLFGGVYRQLQLTGNYRIQQDVTDEKSLVLDRFQYVLNSTAPRQEFQLSAPGYGTGWAFDAGVTYEIGKEISGRAYNAETPFADLRPAYLLRLSAAVMNSGSLRFSGSQSRELSGNSTRTVLFQKDLDRLGDDIVSQFPTVAPGAPSERPGGAMTIELPGMLHLEADLRLARSFYLNGTYLKNMSAVSGSTASMPDRLIVTPRFEDADAEVAFPVSIIDGNQRVAVGMSARVGPLALGFSNLTSMLHKNGDHRGTYAWVGLSFWGWHKE